MALILRNSHCHTSALTIQRPFIGPGCSVHELNTFLGRKLEGLANKLANLTGHDPSILAGRIEQLFGSSPDDRQLKLDILYQDAAQIPKLRSFCIKLLDFSWPSSSPETQRLTFGNIILLITRYPGLRRLFCHHKQLPMSYSTTDISKDWKRKDCEPGKEWDFYCEFAAFCLQTSTLSEIVEKSKPSLLGHIAHNSLVTSGRESSNWNLVPIEQLLIFSRDGPDFNFPRLAATHYVAGILELPFFWTHCKDARKFHEVLNNICRTTLRLITDSDFDLSGDDPQDTYPWMQAAFSSIDALAHSLLVGLSRLNLVKLRLRDIDELLTQLIRPVSQSRFPNAIRVLHSSPAIGYLLQSLTENLNNLTLNPKNLPYVSAGPSPEDVLLSDSVQFTRNLYTTFTSKWKFRSAGKAETPISLSWPLVELNQRKRKKPHLYFDIGFDPRYDMNVRIYRGGVYSRMKPEEERLPVSSHCTVTKMVIICKELSRWSVIVERREGLRCFDVFYGIYKTFHEPLTKREEREIDRSYLDRCRGAFEQRCRDSPRLYDWNRQQGMRRVDLLRGHRVFKGIKQSGAEWTLMMD